MRRVFHLLLTVLVILFVFGVPISSVKASDGQALELTPTETYVKTELVNNGLADLSSQTDKTIRGEFLSELLASPELQAKPFITIKGATVDGDVEAAGLTLPFNVELQGCMFKGGIDLASAQTKTFRIDTSTVTGPVKMGRMIVSGDLALYQSTFWGEVTLFGADIGKNLFAKGSKFLATVPDPNSLYPFEVWTTHVGQTAEFTDSLIKGDAIVDDAKIDGDVKFNGVTFERLASFRNIEVGNIANFQEARFKRSADFDSSTVDLDFQFAGAVFNGKANFANTRVGNKADFENVTFGDEVDFESSIMDRDIAFTGSAFNGNANFDYVAVARFFDFNDTKLNQGFSFQYSTVGWPYFAGTTFNGKVNFEGVEASNDFDFTGAKYYYSVEPFTVTLAKVTGAGIFEDFVAPSGLSLEHNQFGELSISGGDNQKFAFIALDSTNVDGDLKMDKVNTNKFSAEGFTAKGSTIFTQVTVTNELNMSNASIGAFSFSKDKFSWPQIPDDPNAFNLRGMTYTDIGLVNQELNDATWNVLLKMVEDSAYSPQAYRTLEQFLTEKGQPDWAADVELNRKIRERNQILPHRSGSWYWSWFLYIFSGYGQRPQFAFGWSLLVIMIGALVFRREKDMVILDDSEAKPAYSPILYSFALFLPYIDLDIASKWDPKPERKFASLYKHIHRLLGWVLMPIALLTFGGIIK